MRNFRLKNKSTMNPLRLLVLLVSLPLLLGGCGEKHEGVAETKLKTEGVNVKELEVREGIYYFKDTPYTGKSYALFPNGNKQWEANFKNGKLDGPSNAWYENGQKNVEANYKNSKREGLHLGWYENGNKQWEANYKNGKRDGLWTEWHENGQKEEEGNFKGGKYDGLTMEWHDNGQKKAEATLKDGELIAAKYWNSKGEPVKSREEAK